ncbi:hypothetical protein M3Y97_00182300 [Aphelenchoides bicaudatus]|nr:hypothetical protein M3Y97_00182300 [Aphelenchoides bicaudatus]
MTPEVQLKCPKHHETPFQVVLRQFSTLFGFIGRIAFVAIFIAHFYFGKGYFLAAIPFLSLISLVCVFLAFKFKNLRFFIFVMSIELISAVGLFIIGVYLFVEISTQDIHTYSILLPGLLLRDVRAVCGILLIYPPMQMLFLYVIYQGCYNEHKLFPNFKPVTNDKSTRRAMLCYKSQKYLILITLILLLALWAVLTARLAALEQCGRPCPQGDSFFMDSKFGDQYLEGKELEKFNSQLEKIGLEAYTFSYKTEEFIQ